MTLVTGSVAVGAFPNLIRDDATSNNRVTGFNASPNKNAPLKAKKRVRFTDLTTLSGFTKIANANKTDNAIRCALRALGTIYDTKTIGEDSKPYLINNYNRFFKLYP